MRTSLGVSAGSGVVCSAVLSSTPSGTQTFDYRIIAADVASVDLGDLVCSAIELMTTQLPRPAVEPSGIAVAYRTREQTQAVRSAIGARRRDLRLVPEASAGLAYLRHTGEVARYQTIALVDLGASGLTVSVIDQISGTVLKTRRTTTVSGNAIDELVCGHLITSHDAGQPGQQAMGTGGARLRPAGHYPNSAHPGQLRPNREMLLVRGRTAKEHLSTAPVVTVDHVAGRPLKLTRNDFDGLISGLLSDACVFIADVIASAERSTEFVAVVGGGANIPAVRGQLGRHLSVPVRAIAEPEAVYAKGAALLADSTQSTAFPVVSLAADRPVGTFTKVAGVIAGAAIVVGLIVGYGVSAFTADSNGVAPAGSQNDQTATSTTQTPTTVPAIPAPGPAKNSGPTLHPDPDLPEIPLPWSVPRPPVTRAAGVTTAPRPVVTKPPTTSGLTR